MSRYPPTILPADSVDGKRGQIPQRCPHRWQKKLPVRSIKKFAFANIDSIIKNALNEKMPKFKEYLSE
jgi:hypothetical protein